MTMLEETSAFLARVLVPGAPKVTSLPIEQARRMVNGAVELLDLPAPALPRVETFAIPGAIPGPAGEINVRLYDPMLAGGNAPVVLFFHGGGWVFGSLASHNGLCAEIAEQLGLRVLAVDYRLAPEHPFPAALEDAAAAAAWLASSPDVLNGRVTGLILAGDSAGGNIAAVLANQFREAAPAPILAQLLLYPAVDMIGSYESAKSFAQGFMLDEEDLLFFTRSYLPRRALRADPRVSPLLADSFTGLPPTVIATCGLDPLRDQGRAYAARLAEAGVPVHHEEIAGQIHGCFTMRKALPSAQERLIRCLDILRGMLH